jgi:solute carrier family 35 protein F1/2
MDDQSTDAVNEQTPKQWTHVVLMLGLGQFLAFLIALTGLSAGMLAALNDHWSPALLNVSVYFGLTVAYGLVFLRGALNRRQYVQINDERLSWTRLDILLLLALGLADLYANLLLIKAYEYTSVLSVLLLDAWTVPCVVCIGCLLRMKFGERWDVYLINMKQTFGIFLCIVGLIGLAYEDWRSSRYDSGDNSGETRYPFAWFGNILVVAGATLYAVSNICQEALLKSGKDRNTILLILGIFGSLLGSLHLVIFERQNIVLMSFTAQNVLYIALFALSMVLFYTLVTIMLKNASSATLNLSLLGSDFYGAIFSVFVFHTTFSPLYVLFMSFILLGLILFNTLNKS